jgi:hypothetical protein
MLAGDAGVPRARPQTAMLFGFLAYVRSWPDSACPHFPSNVRKADLPRYQVARKTVSDPLRASAVQMFCVTKSLFDHLVGTQHDRLRYHQTERFRGLEVYGRLKLCRQLNG